MNQKRGPYTNIKAQATLELAIVGTIVLMLLATLVSQAYFQNQVLDLEMDTFIKALALSKTGGVIKDDEELPRPVTLITIRDVIVPSFFTGIFKQRLISSASIDNNPYILYNPLLPQYVEQRQLLQIGDKMIQQGKYIEIPPTSMEIVTREMADYPDGVLAGGVSTGQADTIWSASWIKEIEYPQITSTYNYTTNVSESPESKSTDKQLSSHITAKNKLTFVPGERIREDMVEKQFLPPGDDNYILDTDQTKVIETPQDIEFTIEEEIQRRKLWKTPHE